jgi:hypothetical protein
MIGTHTSNRTLNALVTRGTAACLAALSLGLARTADASTVYVQDSGVTNTIGNSSYLQMMDPNPNSIYFFTPNWDPGARAGIYNNHPTGVWFDSNRQNWAIYNEDRTAMPLSAAFNVLTRPAASNVYVHHATTSNSRGDFTYLDNIWANNNPGALIWVTHNWNPGGVGGIYNNHNIGVWYDAGVGKWAIFNQDGAPIPNGASFNVLVESGAYPLHYDVRQATIAMATLPIDNVNINGDPNAVLLVTPVWNPGGVGGVYNDHAIGVYYDQNGKWNIFNQDGATIPAGAAFNVWVLRG